MAGAPAISTSTTAPPSSAVRMEHLESYLAADEFVPPEHTVNIADDIWTTSSLNAAFHCR